MLWNVSNCLYVLLLLLLFSHWWHTYFDWLTLHSTVLSVSDGGGSVSFFTFNSGMFCRWCNSPCWPVLHVLECRWCEGSTLPQGNSSLHCAESCPSMLILDLILSGSCLLIIITLSYFTNCHCLGKKASNSCILLSVHSWLGDSLPWRLWELLPRDAL